MSKETPKRPVDSIGDAVRHGNEAHTSYILVKCQKRPNKVSKETQKRPVDGIGDAVRHGNKALTSDSFVLEEPRYSIPVLVLGFPYVHQLLRPLYIDTLFSSKSNLIRSNPAATASPFPRYMRGKVQIVTALLSTHIHYLT